MHTQSSNAELKSSCFRLTARELRSSELGEVTKQMDCSHKRNLSLNNLHDKSTIAQYSICNLN